MLALGCSSGPASPVADIDATDDQVAAGEPEVVAGTDVVPEVEPALEVADETADPSTDAGPDLEVSEPEVVETPVLPVDLTGIADAPGRLFRVVPSDQFGGPPISISMAIADFNGDGRPDIFMPWRPSIMLYNQGDAGFAVEQMDLDWPDMMISVQAVDVDGDGRVDVVIGADEHIRVAFNKSGGWEMGPPVPTVSGGATPGFTFIPDFDGDGRSDGAMVAQYAWPPGEPGFLNTMEEGDGHLFGANALVYIGKNGAMESLPLKQFAPSEVSACTDTMSWLALFLPRHRWGLPGVIWTGNECSDDCWTPYDPDAHLLTGLIGGDHVGAANGTMGGDYWIEEDGILVASSQFTGRDPSVWKLPWEGEVEDVSSRLVRTHFDGYDLTWGVTFENNYLMVASGHRIFQNPEFQAMFENRPGSLADLTSPGRLLIFERNAETGEYVQDHDLLPPEIDGIGRYHIGAGDFYGNDGHGDGCVDAIVTPMYVMPDVDSFEAGALEEQMEFLGVNAMLLNTCILDGGPGQFVGVDLPAVGWALGAIVETTTASGKTLVRASRSTSGVGGSRDPRVIVPVSADDPPAEVRVFYASGAEEVLSYPEIGIYHPVTGPTE